MERHVCPRLVQGALFVLTIQPIRALPWDCELSSCTQLLRLCSEISALFKFSCLLGCPVLSLLGVLSVTPALTVQHAPHWWLRRLEGVLSGPRNCPLPGSGFVSLDPDETLLVPTDTGGEHGLEGGVSFGGVGTDYFYNLKLWLFRGSTNF